MIVMMDELISYKRNAELCLAFCDRIELFIESATVNEKPNLIVPDYFKLFDESMALYEYYAEHLLSTLKDLLDMIAIYAEFLISCHRC